MSPSTTCDTKKEKMCDEKLSELVKCLETQRDESLEFIKTQKVNVERLWRVAERFNIIKDHNLALDMYPESVVPGVKSEMMEEMNYIVRKWRRNIGEIFSSQNSLRQKHRQFESLTNELDMQVESPFIQGSSTQKPLQFYLTVFVDILYCYDVFLLHMKTYGDMISIRKTESLIKLKEALILNDNFLEYIDHVITSYNCKGVFGS